MIQHPAAYFLPDICKVTWQLLRGGGGVCLNLTKVYILSPTPLTFSALSVSLSPILQQEGSLYVISQHPILSSLFPLTLLPSLKAMAFREIEEYNQQHSREGWIYG